MSIEKLHGVGNVRDRSAQLKQEAARGKRYIWLYEYTMQRKKEVCDGEVEEEEENDDHEIEPDDRGKKAYVKHVVDERENQK